MGSTGNGGGGGISTRGATSARYTRQPGGVGNRRATIRREQENEATQRRVRRNRGNVRNTGR